MGPSGDLQNRKQTTAPELPNNVSFRPHRPNLLKLALVANAGSAVQFGEWGDIWVAIAAAG